MIDKMKSIPTHNAEMILSNSQLVDFSAGVHRDPRHELRKHAIYFHDFSQLI